MNKIENHFDFLLAQLPESRRAAAKADWAQVIEQNLGDIDSQFMGFIDTYVGLAQILRKTRRFGSEEGESSTPRRSPKMVPLPWTVVDVGCAYGFQHVLFADERRYIGVDVAALNQTPHTDNAVFIHGHFEESWDKIEALLPSNKDQVFAIANMSLLYHAPPETISMFKNKFNRLWML